MEEELKKPDLSEHLRIVNRTVLGANVAFLPFFLYYLTKDAHVQIEVAVFLWLLTSLIVLVEWQWREIDFLSFSTQSYLYFFLEICYVFLLLSLPISVIVFGTQVAVSGTNGRIVPDLEYFILNIMLLCGLDAVICFYLYKKTAHKISLIYAIFDVIFVGYYSISIGLLSKYPSQIAQLSLITGFYMGEIFLTNYVVPKAIPAVKNL